MLTVVVSDDIGYINFAIAGFRPQTIMQGGGFGASLGAMTSDDDVISYPNAIMVTV